MDVRQGVSTSFLRFSIDIDVYVNLSPGRAQSRNRFTAQRRLSSDILRFGRHPTQQCRQRLGHPAISRATHVFRDLKDGIWYHSLYLLILTQLENHIRDILSSNRNSPPVEHAAQLVLQGWVINGLSFPFYRYGYRCQVKSLKTNLSRQFGRLKRYTAYQRQPIPINRLWTVIWQM